MERAARGTWVGILITSPQYIFHCWRVFPSFKGETQPLTEAEHFLWSLSPAANATSIALFVVTREDSWSPEGPSACAKLPGLISADWLAQEEEQSRCSCYSSPHEKGESRRQPVLGLKMRKKKNLLKFKIHSALEEGPQCCWKAECSWLTAVSDFFINPNKMCLFSTCTFMQINWLHNLPNVACIHSGEVYILSQTTFYKYSRFLQNST